jgi:type III secretion system FlhB-like substrate exporter
MSNRAVSIRARLLNLAKKEGIETVKDKSAVELLSKADLYEGIPQEAYEVISEILLYVYEIEKEGKET